MTEAEEAALKAYPEDKKIWKSAFGTLEFDKYAVERKAFQEGYKQAQEDILALIQSRINEIPGDAQPNPILRMELQELIKKIEA